AASDRPAGSPPPHPSVVQVRDDPETDRVDRRDLGLPHEALDLAAPHRHLLLGEVGHVDRLGLQGLCALAVRGDEQLLVAVAACLQVAEVGAGLRVVLAQRALLLQEFLEVAADLHAEGQVTPRVLPHEIHSSWRGAMFRTWALTQGQETRRPMRYISSDPVSWLRTLTHFQSIHRAQTFRLTLARFAPYSSTGRWPKSSSETSWTAISWNRG